MNNWNTPLSTLPIVAPNETISIALIAFISTVPNDLPKLTQSNFAVNPLRNCHTLFHPATSNSPTLDQLICHTAPLIKSASASPRAE